MEQHPKSVVRSPQPENIGSSVLRARNWQLRLHLGQLSGIAPSVIVVMDLIGMSRITAPNGSDIAAIPMQLHHSLAFSPVVDVKFPPNSTIIAWKNIVMQIIPLGEPS